VHHPNGGLKMDIQFGFFEEMDRYEAMMELNSYHDFLDSIPVVVTEDEINIMLSELAELELIERIENEVVC
jgi:hypothetical protein